MTDKHNEDEQERHEGKEVEITVNSKEREMLAGNYSVSFLKEQWNIPAEHELNLFKEGKFIVLGDNETIEIHEGDIFSSQVKSGGAS